MILDLREPRGVEATDDADAGDDDGHPASVRCVLQLAQARRLVERRASLLVLDLRRERRSLVALDGAALAGDPVVGVGQGSGQRGAVDEPPEMVHLDDDRQPVLHGALGGLQAQGECLGGVEGGELQIAMLLLKGRGGVVPCGHPASVAVAAGVGR